MKKYVIVGASLRAYHMFAKPIMEELHQTVVLAGLFDINPIRADILSRECGNIPIYDDFDHMIHDAKPDAVIVTTIDSLHHEYIIKALEAGCDAITEKPMTIDAAKCRSIIEAERRTGKKVIVTFNYRFVPYATRIKELMKAGTIGRVLSVDFEWLLDMNMDYGAHGASYFRRWNKYMDKSGGLLVHKSTHHFDLINWWLEENPEEVHAFGTLRMFGPNREERSERCLTCNYKHSCEFYIDITSIEFYKKYYYDAEKVDGYYRDTCVFADDIDIYDTMSVNVKYAKGTLLSYSLIAHSPYEGWRLAINGTEGRLEAAVFETGHRSKENSEQIVIYDRRGERITHDVMKSSGGHGGGDERLRRMLFVGDLADPLGHQADSMAGAMSILVGIASNISIADKRPVLIQDLLTE